MPFLVDPDIFGNPNAAFGQSPGMETVKALGDVGASQFVQYNPTAPVEVSASYTWTGAQFNEFRVDWRNLYRWGHGSQWVLLDLPLMMSDALEAKAARYPYSQKVQHFMSVTVGQDGTRFGWQQLGGGNQTGAFSGGLVQGWDVFRATIDTLDTSFRFKFGHATDTVILRGGNNPTGAKVIFPDTGEESVMGVGTINYVTFNMSTDAPLAYANWQVAGSELPVIFEIDGQKYQRYLVHCTGPYTARQVGFDTWNVSLALEADMSPKLTPVPT